jgi:hypothetical protein
VGVALDAEGVISFMHHAVTGWAVAPLLAAHLAVGLLAGILYLRALRRATEIFAAGGGIAGALRMGAARFAAIGVVLFLAALEGALPLLAMAAGVLLARWVMVRLPRADTA